MTEKLDCPNRPRLCGFPDKCDCHDRYLSDGSHIGDLATPEELKQNLSLGDEGQRRSAELARKHPFLLRMETITR